MQLQLALKQQRAYKAVLNERGGAGEKVNGLVVGAVLGREAFYRLVNARDKDVRLEHGPHRIRHGDYGGVPVGGGA